MSCNVASAGLSTSRNVASGGPTMYCNVASAGPSTSRRPSTSSGRPSTSSGVISIDDNKDDLPLLCKHGARNPAEDIAKLLEIFPNIDENQLKYLYDLSI